MRALILAVAVLGISASANAAKAGLSTTPREVSASIDTATPPDEATLETEDQIGLTKAKRREVQRRLRKLGFDTKVSGKFDELDPRRHHALAGGTRLSQDRLHQHGAAQGAAERERRSDRDRQIQRPSGPSRRSCSPFPWRGRTNSRDRRHGGRIVRTQVILPLMNRTLGSLRGSPIRLIGARMDLVRVPDLRNR